MRTARLVLRPLTDMDRGAFAALHTAPGVVELLGSSPTPEESDDMIDRYRAEMERQGWGLWAVEQANGAPFIGMVGLQRVRQTMPFAPAIEVGWWLHPDHWGHGYATEAAKASLAYGFDTAGMDEIVAFTTTRNTRSQAVMERIGMVRDPHSAFDHPGLPEGSELRHHVLYRKARPAQQSQVGPGVAR